MRILVVGAGGFLGRNIVRSLAARGHEVVAGVRMPAEYVGPCSGVSAVQLDLLEAEISTLAEKLRGIDVVVNAAGLFHERREGDFSRVHFQGPLRLFKASRAAGVRRIVQISAFGASSDATAPFLRSKALADDALAQFDIEWVVLRPSLVMGAGGASWRLFRALSLLPFEPAEAEALVVQPIAIDDVCRAVAAAATRDDADGRIINLVSPEPLSLRTYLDDLSEAMSGRPRRRIALPWALLDILGLFARLKPGAPVSRDAFRMLRSARQPCDSRVCQRYLGLQPRSVSEYLAANPADRGDRLDARLYAAAPMLRLVLGFMWLWSGVVSLGLYPVEASLELLAQTGISGPLAYPTLVAAAAIDVVVGLWVVVTRRPGVAAVMQAGLVIFYTLILTVCLPELWLHPFGPVMKNIPVLALIAVWRILEEEN